MGGVERPHVRLTKHWGDHERKKERERDRKLALGIGMRGWSR